MKNKIFNTTVLFSLLFLAAACISEEDIKLRAPAVIVKAITPQGLGIVHKLSVQEFDKSIQDKVGILVDVRTPEEYMESHLTDAININFKKRTFPSYISTLDKEKPVLIYCRSGNRSGKVIKIMQALGFKEIHELEKGFKAWNAKNMAISTAEVEANTALYVQLETDAPTPTSKTGLGIIHEIEVDEFDALGKGGDVTLVDLRTPKEFAEGHIEGAVNVDWRNRSFLEEILKITDEKPIAVYCRSGNRSSRAMLAMQAIGFKEVYHLNKGVKSWKAANKELKTLKVEGDPLRLDVANFNNAILGQVGVLVDVRTPKEYEDYHIPTALNVDYKNSNFKTEFSKLDKSEPVLIYCRSGKRSARAAKIIKKLGFKVYNLNKGMKDWKGQGMRLEGKNIAAKDTGEEGC